MRVYVLFDNPYSQPKYLLGICSTYEKAEVKKAELEDEALKLGFCSYVVIEIVEVD